MTLWDDVHTTICLCLIQKQTDNCVYGLWDVQLSKKLRCTCNHNNFIKENLHNVLHAVRTNYALFLLALAWSSCNYTHPPVPKKHLSIPSPPLHLKECFPGSKQADAFLILGKCLADHVQQIYRPSASIWQLQKTQVGKRFSPINTIIWTSLSTGYRWIQRKRKTHG